MLHIWHILLPSDFAALPLRPIPRVVSPSLSKVLISRAAIALCIDGAVSSFAHAAFRPHSLRLYTLFQASQRLSIPTLRDP